MEGGIGIALREGAKKPVNVRCPFISQSKRILPEALVGDESEVSDSVPS